MQQKLQGMGQLSSFERNFARLFSIFEEEGYIMQNPTGEPYQASRTDCEASIVGSTSSKMAIVKTLKPIIYKKQDGALQLLQKAIVIAEKG